MKERIAEIIKVRKITKTEFAKTLNVSQAFVSQLCSGASNPSERTILDICQKFRIREEWLREGKGNMEVDDSQREKLENFFSDVLTTAPDERSAFIAALDNLPPEFWPMVVELAKKIAAEYKEKG